MIGTMDLRGRQPTPAELRALLPRATLDIGSSTESARAIVDAVRTDGEPALRDQARRFDGVEGHALRVPAEHLAEALAGLTAELRDALETVIARVRIASAAQLSAPVSVELGAGARVSQRWQPIDRVGLYVPGGKAVYPSSVVMNVVPAQVAGVRSIALTSPPQRAFDGRVHPTILAAAALLGIDEVYAMGGAGAIAAFAFGVDAIGLDPVDLVTGPGNNYVAAAKRLVQGIVGTDSEAGATEILVIADASADAGLVAADLVSQAEHDEQAAALLVTASAELADAVRERLPALIDATLHSDRVRVALAGPQSALVLVDDLEAAATFSDAYGPEHLELQVADTQALLARIRNAGAIFVGPSSPVSLGDYLAGSNHVLPTGGQARFRPGLGAHTFVRPQQVIEYSADALAEVSAKIVALASEESLPAHGEAVTARFV